jgi:hypothetical protein
MLGVPVPDATQWDQSEKVCDCSYVVFEHLEPLAAQGELIYQDDTSVRMLTLIKANQAMQAQAEALGFPRSTERTGMFPTALVVKGGSGPFVCPTPGARMPERLWPGCWSNAQQMMPSPW